MCGIAGFFKQSNQDISSYLNSAIVVLNKRGPDFATTKILDNLVGFAHARLSIIDTSAVAHQPMADASGRYTIVFNGEIFNYRELRQTYLQNVVFSSSSDSEVLLYLFIKFGKECLRLLNGFFAFAVYDNELKRMFLARDRYGIKPLVYYTDGNHFYFASELKALLQFDIKREIDFDTLGLYLQLNYVPGTMSMLKGVSKLKPGHYLEFDQQIKLEEQTYYQVPFRAGQKIEAANLDYAAAKVQLRKLIEAAVERRLIADVPLGSFLSGGIDSSIVTACAVKHAANLNTFSIGFKDEPYFDETKYANLVAKKFKTNHTVFSISNDEMFSNIFSILDYIDEPFADSSAIAVYILSQKTRQKVTVALSGDGGDELFGGYNKHVAEFRIRQNSLTNSLLRPALPFFRLLPKSRHSKFGNLFRQMERYSEGLGMSRQERYWRWCTLTTQKDALVLLKKEIGYSEANINSRKKFVLDNITENGDLNDVLLADTKMVLPNDMLTKVDLMSMANSLEVRVPLLDYTVVDFAFSLPVFYKTSATSGKKILKEAFADELPYELFNRPKHGFEVPLLKWMKTGLNTLIEQELLSDEFVQQQNIFDVTEIKKLKLRMYSNSPGDVHATLWGLLVFQYWYKKYII
jgi:asparagine synthase (glutamine-hydrolysing)